MQINISVRFLAAVLSVALFALAGCSKSDEIRLDPKNPVTIVIWHYYNGAQKTAFDDAVQEFNDTMGYETGIIAEAVSYGGVDELAENVLGAAKSELDAGNMPDIFGAYGDTALAIQKMGKIAEIDDYITTEELAEYEQPFIHEGKIGTDRLYVFPIAKSTETLMINKTDFDAFINGLKSGGFTEAVSYEDLATWEGILKTADIYYNYTKSISSNNEGKALMGIDSLANYFIIGSKQLGLNIVEVTNGEVVKNLDREILAKLWDMYYRSMVTGRFVKLGRFCSDDIKTGDSLCYIGSTASASYFPNEIISDSGDTKEIELMVLPMPVFENGDKTAISQGAGMAVAKSEKQTEYAAAMFLKWFTSAERNVPFALNSSYLPVKRDALDKNVLSKAFDDIQKSGSINAIKALEVGIEQLKSYNMYSNDVFEEGAAFRAALQNVLIEIVMTDRALYVELLNKGMEPEQAYEELRSQSNIKFDDWIESLS